ncbi:MAG: 2,3-bisphosphoglycerate-independent phosphoglycerate mutase [Proteobacteria bacterium]|nr:2,3-bisphosphoglycerate-independent phosphoglycerate mutase [Desulfobacula sp.]MBU3953176.1 2,3-bisphosphoglycerate-independent phosphoglycerate mutase [Pseudomonadota bacterium]MBU4130811.1 2,3-bisphosphoglycerate-independent phosphoglycerate mutase [Pseudomonadota bacterium]
MKTTFKSKPVSILMILDGWGIAPPGPGNSFALAKTPFLDQLLKDFPNCHLACSGTAVGLPDGTMGNSEVGHMNMGAGRKVFQDFVRINAAIDDTSFFKNPGLLNTMKTVRENKTSLHLLGLLSDGGVHSHISHLFALIDMAKQNQIKNLYIHPILDGRDTSPTSGITYIRQLQEHLDRAGTGRIASICGRYWAMDRDTRWDRVEKAYRLYTSGEGKLSNDPIQAVQDAYDAKETDEFISPVFFESNADTNKGFIRDEDGLIFFNFRADRAKEITRAFIEADFKGFKRKEHPSLSNFVTMTQYDQNFHLPTAFAPQHLTNGLGEVLSRQGIPQLRIAETEKYAHVTYFFNGGNEQAFDGEHRIMIPSPRDVATYDQKPSMSAEKVAETVCEQIRSGKFEFIVLNFANMDMVGHTGVLSAAIKGCETVDACVRQVAQAIWETGGIAFITADHGNSEQMIADDGSPHTAHTLNQVPFILAGTQFKDTEIRNGILGDISPTVLKALGLTQPAEMTGTPLI